MNTKNLIKVKDKWYVIHSEWRGKVYLSNLFDPKGRIVKEIDKTKTSRSEITLQQDVWYGYLLNKLSYNIRILKFYLSN
jgi:hypothetical protein